MAPGVPANHCGLAPHEPMNTRICRCCGEPMPEQGNRLSRNPNVCASCSSLADGMDESDALEGLSLAPAAKEPTGPERLGRETAEAVVCHEST